MTTKEIKLLRNIVERSLETDEEIEKLLEYNTSWFHANYFLCLGFSQKEVDMMLDNLYKEDVVTKETDGTWKLTTFGIQTAITIWG